MRPKPKGSDEESELDNTSSSTEIEYSDNNTNEKSNNNSSVEDSGDELLIDKPISNRLRRKQKDTDDFESNKLPKRKINQKEKPLNLLEDFPAWHPAQMTDELDLYKQAQQQKKSAVQ